MARKRIARSKLSKSGKYYRDNPDKAKKKAKYDTKYHSTDKRKKYRRELQRERSKRGIAGKGGGDLHHSKEGKLKRESVKKNRGRREKSRRKGYKKK